MDDFNFSDSWTSFKNQCSMTWDNKDRLGTRFADNYREGFLHPIDSFQNGVVGENLGGISLNNSSDIAKQEHYAGLVGKTIGQATSICTMAKVAQIGYRAGAYGCAYLSSRLANTQGNANVLSTNSGCEYASSSSQAVKLRNSLIAREIAGGHAFEKHILHQGEYAGWIRTKTQFADHILNVITKPTATKLLKNGRTGYWHEQTKSVVIRVPQSVESKVNL